MTVLEPPSPGHQAGTNHTADDAFYERLEAVLNHSPALLLPTAVFSVLTLLEAIREARNAPFSVRFPLT
jgi:hypothetical protein